MNLKNHRLYSIICKILVVGSACVLASGCSHHVESPESLIAVQIQDRNGITETVSIPERLQNYQNIDFLSSQPYKKVLRVYKKDGKNRSVITAYHPNGNIAQYLEAEDMRAHGYFREWFANGQLKIEAIVIGGTADITPAAKRDWLFDGICRVWDERENLLAAIPYAKGFLEGMSTSYFPSGSIQKQTPYTRNLEEGESVEFYPNGKLKLRQTFRKGMKHGATSVYFENGQTACMEEYSDGLLLHGMYHNTQGDLIANVRDGRGIQALYDNQTVSLLVEIHQGIADGAIRKFTPKGELFSSYFVKNGRKQGEEIEYYPSSDKEAGQLQPKLSVHWDQDMVHGIVKTWYPTGQLESQREYCRNERLGASCAWYKNGSLMLVEEYEEGRLVKGAYYKKGQNEPVSTILNGNGIASLYDENGIFMKKIIYANGKPSQPED